jgi:glycosidase
MLTARDPDGNLDRTRQYFTLTATGQVIPATIRSNPAWVKQARVYEIFIHSFTPAGTLNAAAAKLDYIKAMGFNVIWLMPIMDNNFRIDVVGAGYDIVDFYRVAPEFGTNDDFLAFVDRAHQLGMRVVLDITPNHTSQAHPFAADIRAYREHSPYWNYYQHDLISNSNYHPNLQGSGAATGCLFITTASARKLSTTTGPISMRACIWSRHINFGLMKCARTGSVSTFIGGRRGGPTTATAAKMKWAFRCAKR